MCTKDYKCAHNVRIKNLNKKMHKFTTKQIFETVELFSASRLILTITHPSGIESRKSIPGIGNSPALAVGHQSKSAQNVGHRDNIDYRFLRRLVEEFSSRVRNLSPPIRLTPAKFNLNECTP